MSKAVYFDATFLAHGRDLRGVPQVILQLIRLFVIDEAFAGVRFISTPAITKDFLAGLGVSRGRIIHLEALPFLGRYERFHGLFSTFRYRSILPGAALIIHPEPRTVVRSAVPQMVMHHDFIIFERIASGERRKWTRYLLYLHKNRVAAKVRFKFTNSEFTRRRALALFPAIAPESIASVLIGSRIEPVVVPKAAPDPGRPLRFLYVGSYEPRKNVLALVSAFGKVAGEARSELHLAGRMAPAMAESIRAAAEGIPGRPRINIHGLVTDKQLATLYAECDFLVFPSLFEGFGLPIVEAMAHGMVVCAFRNSSLPEIGGDAVLFAGDNDFAAWGKAVSGLVSDPEAYRRASGRSLARAALFTEKAMRARYREYFLAAFASLRGDDGRRAVA